MQDGGVLGPDLVCVCVCVCVQAGGVLGPDLELVLRAVLSKMQSVTTPSVMQSLLLVFARLIQTEVSDHHAITMVTPPVLLEDGECGVLSLSRA